MRPVSKRAHAPIVQYITFAFLWTWVFWGAALLLSHFSDRPLETDMTLFTLFATYNSPYDILVKMTFALAVFGPMVGYIAMRKYKPFVGNPTWQLTVLVILVPLLSLLPAIVVSLFTVPPNAELTVASALISIGTYFISNILTSGTEEFGWRGYLYPALKSREKKFWTVAWKGGLIWAAWHIPLMFIMYWSLGWLMVPTLIGFVASIIAMNYITNAIYERSNSIVLTMILHALNNTASFALVLLFPETPYTIIIAAMAWVFVGILERRYKFD